MLVFTATAQVQGCFGFKVLKSAVFVLYDNQPNCCALKPFHLSALKSWERVEYYSFFKIVLIAQRLVYIVSLFLLIKEKQCIPVL